MVLDESVFNCGNWLKVCSVSVGVRFLEISSMDMIIGTLCFGAMFLVTGIVDVLIDRFQYQIEINEL